MNSIRERSKGTSPAFSGPRMSSMRGSPNTSIPMGWRYPSAKRCAPPDISTGFDIRSDRGDRVETDVFEGGCLCSAIRYRVTGTPLAASNCHCRSCRRASGAASVAWVVFRYSDFSFITGKPVSFHSSPPVTRTFCGKCGTPLTYQHNESLNTIDVTTSTLDSAERFAPTREIWIEHKLPWEPLNESLQHFPRSSRENPQPAT